MVAVHSLVELCSIKQYSHLPYEESTFEIIYYQRRSQISREIVRVEKEQSMVVLMVFCLSLAE